MNSFDTMVDLPMQIVQDVAPPLHSSNVKIASVLAFSARLVSSNHTLYCRYIEFWFVDLLSFNYETVLTFTASL